MGNAARLRFKRGKSQGDVRKGNSSQKLVFSAMSVVNRPGCWLSEFFARPRRRDGVRACHLGVCFTIMMCVCVCVRAFVDQENDPRLKFKRGKYQEFFNFFENSNFEKVIDGVHFAFVKTRTIYWWSPFCFCVDMGNAARLNTFYKRTHFILLCL